METAFKGERLRVEDYLTAEETSEIRHEYLGGLVYARSGETTTHNQICQNLLLLFRPRLKAGPCKSWPSLSRRFTTAFEAMPGKARIARTRRAVRRSRKGFGVVYLLR
jgi:hypothetical protein